MTDDVFDVEDEHTQADADLGSREAGTGGVEKRVGQVGDERAQLLIEIDDRIGPACATPGRRRGGSG